MSLALRIFPIPSGFEGATGVEGGQEGLEDIQGGIALHEAPVDNSSHT
jgi:hypothetical protein